MKSDYIKDELIHDLYCAGGVSPRSYGFLSSGYGGGVEQEQLFRLLQLDGFIQGLSHGTGQNEEFWEFVGDLNERLLTMYPNDPDLTRETVPFKWGPE